ncbi:MAG: SdrD B-like domain-containing protein [Planctomycetota bacterium]
MYRILASSIASSLTAALLLSAPIAAQSCSDNTYPIRLVDAAGVELPFAAGAYGAPDEQVYLAFDAGLPSGLYYVHVTDPIGGHDEVLSTNDPVDRYVQVTNTGGVITLARPFSVDPDAPAFGQGLGGEGQSLPLFPFRSADWDPCQFKAWLGDCWSDPVDPSNPYLLRGGYDAARGACCVRSYASFGVGDGTGTDVYGVVFEDLDRDGERDAGEPGVAGCEVRLVTPDSSISAITQADGTYRFVDVDCGSYTVSLAQMPGTIPTTPTSYEIEVCGCADIAVLPFGKVAENHRCDGHTIGYWRNRHGRRLVDQHGLLADYAALCLADANGARGAFADLDEYASWLQRAHATNMAYMLSAQMVGMYNNIATGFVSGACPIQDPVLGTIAIQDVVQMARDSLCLHPCTPVGHPERAWQTTLKNALDAANNNQNWLVH